MNNIDYSKTAVEIDANRDYWFLRTEHGINYDAFKDNNFVALGWNEITTDEIRKSLTDSINLRVRISALSKKHEEARAKHFKEPLDTKNIIDLQTTKGKTKASMIINKLQNFYNLKKGDVIVIPSYASSAFSFGIIADERIYEDLKDSNNCLYRKRRKIKWVIHKEFDELDTIFFMLKRNMHAISSIKEELADHIDRVMNDLYYKDGYGHYVIRVKKKEDINAKALFNLGTDLLQLLEIINEENGYKESINETIVKINVQSDGDCLLKGRIGKSIVTLGALIAFAACSSDKYKPKNPEEAVIMQRVLNVIDTLEIDVATR